MAPELADNQLRLAAVVVPEALYFMVLGLLNSRRCPQLLTSRQDFSLLMAAISPIALLALAGAIGMNLALLLAIGVLACLAIVFFLAPGRGTWVIYNLQADQAGRVLKNALDDLGIASQLDGKRLTLAGQNATIELRPFGLLRNVTIRLRGGDKRLQDQLADRLAASVAAVPAEAHPMAVGLMLVATAMMMAPVVTFVHQGPQIVRFIGDLLGQ